MPDNQQPSPSSRPGVFITRGMGIQIPAGGLALSVGDDGQLTSSLKLRVALDMCPYWLEIALGHLEAAATAHDALVEAITDEREEAVGAALEREFTASMQAIGAAATAMDSLYASLRKRLPQLPSATRAGSLRRPARYKHVMEIVRRACKLRQSSVAGWRTAMREVYRFRNMAVHPAGNFSDPMIHPVLRTATEWRFVAFSAANARHLVRAALAIAHGVAMRARFELAEVKTYADGLRPRTEPLAQSWEVRYGALFDTEPDVANPNDPVPAG